MFVLWTLDGGSLLDDLGHSLLAVIMLWTGAFLLVQKLALFKLTSDETSTGTNVLLVSINGVFAGAMAIGVWLPHALGRYKPEQDPINALMECLPPAITILTISMLASMLARTIGEEHVKKCTTIITILTTYLVLIIITTSILPPDVLIHRQTKNPLLERRCPCSFTQLSPLP